MIKYRPHKGLLDESMKESKEFDTINKMYEYILLSWNNRGFGELFTKEDLSVGENLGADERIGWKETRYICTKRMGNEIYKTPQCIGMCSVE